MANTLSPWMWSSGEGAGRLVADLAQAGYSLFEDAESLSASDDAVAYAERLFGKRPIRYQRMLVEHSPLGNQQSMPKTMFAGALHNDCAQMGMPPQYQVMICEKQSAGGGDSLLLDLWPILERIQAEDPQLFHDLFFVPRAYPSGHATRFGLTWSLMRGNLVCQHPTRIRDGRVGQAFQRHIDSVKPHRFKCQPGQVYVNNNHRCLHGRDAFNDPTRRFVRLLYWFDTPLGAPPHFIEMARAGCAALEKKLANDPDSVRSTLGLGSTSVEPGQAERAHQLLLRLLRPTNCDDWQGPRQRELLRQEALLDAIWQLAAQEHPQQTEASLLFSLVQSDA